MQRLEVFAQVVTCERCELHAQCTAPVPLRGDKARIAIVGEAPGEQEDAEGRPFIGPSGKLITELLAEVGLTQPVGVCNTVSCWPHGKPTWNHVNACADNKWAQIDYIDPTYVLLLGDVALKGMRPDLALKWGRARPFLVRGRVCFASYHPAAALRNGNYHQSLRSELTTFKALVDADNWLSFVPGNCASCSVDADWWEDSGLGWCRLHLPADLVPAYDARQALLAAELDQARLRSSARRDGAVAAVEAAADPEWMTRAWDALEVWLRTHSEFFVDDFWAGAPIEAPRESRALGPLVMRAAREGLMEKSGQFRKSVRSNMTEKPVWRSKVYAP